MAMARSEDFKTPECRLSYASGLYKATPVNAGDKRLTYRATLIFPKSARPELEKHVAEVIKTQWGPAGLERAKKGLVKSPFLDGDGKEARNKSTGDLHPGMGPDVFFIRVSANEERPPHVRWKDPNLQETEANVYSGCFGKAVISAFSWHNDSSGDGVSFGISMFQKLREGDRLGGGTIQPDKWMEAVPDEGPLPETEGAGASGLFG